MNEPVQRIAIICFSHSLGGLELSSLHLAESMRAKGVDAWLVVPPSSPLQARATASGIGTAAFMPRLKYFDCAAALKLFRFLRERRIDTAILMRSQDINIAAMAKLFAPSVRLIFYQQMASGHNKRDVLHTWIYSKLSLWLSLTQHMQNEMLSCTRLPREKAHVVPLGTDLRRFDPSLYAQSDARASFGLPCDRMLVGVLGRLDPGKGQEVFIRAIPSVIARHPEALFVIAGDETANEPGYKKVLEALSAELGVGSHLRFMRFTDDVPRFMAAMDVMTLPSPFETFGLVVIEAMAMEKTVIATNAGGVPELVSDNASGLLIEPRNHGALADAVNRVLDDERLRRRLAANARAAAVRRFDFERCVETILELARTA
ncbi:MAG: glycosyltransferase family 4 protein [Acidobacteriota bacterium]